MRHSGYIGLFIIPLLALCVSFSTPANIYMTSDGFVRFVSEAPLERIEAELEKVGAVIDISQRKVAFEVPIGAFQGFNSDLQREHFNENYMETNTYPKGTFTGKIIEEVDLSQPGTYKVRAKGMLTIHGAAKERIITGTIKVGSGSISVTSNFDVPLEDHNITIPKIVHQKIAEVVSVEVDATLKPKS